MKKLIFLVHFLGYMCDVYRAIVVVDSYRGDNSDTISVSFWKSTPEMIAAEGYPVESHYVTTPDGYIINIHRIPHGKVGRKNNEVVLFIHGLFSSSADAVLFGPEKSLGYILADEGYDVWLVNVRGNIYSRNHTTLNPDTDDEYWNYTFHEVGIIDLPAVVDYILDVTVTDGIYSIGYSQGSTIFLAMTSTRPEYNEKVKVHVALAPVAFMKNVKSPLLVGLSFWRKLLEHLLSVFGMNEFLSRKSIASNVIDEMCSVDMITSLCANILFLLCGSNPQQLNNSLLPLMLSHAPSGCSTRQILHFIQLMQTGKFSQYDLGFLGNLEKYGTVTPPEYDLSKITVPVYIFYSVNDYLATEDGIETMYKTLSNSNVNKILIEDSLWNHMDFVYGINASEVVHSKIISIFKKYRGYDCISEFVRI